jgi:hypothetical protein
MGERDIDGEAQCQKHWVGRMVDLSCGTGVASGHIDPRIQLMTDSTKKMRGRLMALTVVAVQLVGIVVFGNVLTAQAGISGACERDCHCEFEGTPGGWCSGLGWGSPCTMGSECR